MRGQELHKAQDRLQEQQDTAVEAMIWPFPSKIYKRLSVVISIMSEMQVSASAQAHRNKLEEILHRWHLQSPFGLFLDLHVLGGKQVVW